MVEIKGRLGKRATLGCFRVKRKRVYTAGVTATFSAEKETDTFILLKGEQVPFPS